MLVAGSQKAFSPRTVTLNLDSARPGFAPDDAGLLPPAPPQPAAATAPTNASAIEMRRMCSPLTRVRCRTHRMA